MKASWSRLVVGSVCLVVLAGASGCGKRPESTDPKELRDEVLAGRIPMVEVAIEIVPTMKIDGEPMPRDGIGAATFGDIGSTVVPGGPRPETAPGLPPSTRPAVGTATASPATAPVGKHPAETKPTAKAPLPTAPKSVESNPTTAAVVLFGSGVGIWDRKQQFAVTPDQVRDILKALPPEAFARPDPKGRGKDGGTTTGTGQAVKGAIGGPQEDPPPGPGILPAPMPRPRTQPGHVRVVIKGTTTGMEFVEPPAAVTAALKLAAEAVARKSVKIGTLAEALKKLESKELSIETLELSIAAVPLPRHNKKGPMPMRSVRITGLGIDGLHNGVPLPVVNQALIEAAMVLIANDVASLPEGLVAERNVVPFGLRVLDQARHYQMLDTPEIPAERKVRATPEQFLRVQRIQQGLQAAVGRLLDQVPDLPAEHGGQSVPGNPGPPPQVVPDRPAR